MSRSKVKVTGDKKNEKVLYFDWEPPSGGGGASTPVGNSAHAVYSSRFAVLFVWNSLPADGRLCHVAFLHTNDI